jgi:hypothetical protein
MNRLALLTSLILACSSRPLRLLPPDSGLRDTASGDSSAETCIILSVSVSPSDEACSLQTDGTIACWGNEYYPAPAGTFLSLSAGSGYACAVRTDNTVFCWGGDTFGETLPPPGTFTSVSTGWDFACGLKTDGTIRCWGNGAHGDTTPPAGTFTSISLASRNDGYDCGIRTDGTLACWGDNAQGETQLPGGTFTSVNVGAGGCPCGIRPDGTIACCKVPVGDPRVECLTPPTGPFTMISGDQYAYYLKTDGTIVSACPNPRVAQPSGTFISVSVGATMACEVKEDGTIYCWPIT